MDQRLQATQQQSTAKRQEQYQRWAEDGHRLWNKFQVSYPELAADPAFRERLRSTWEAAQGMNSRSAEPLDADSLYNNTVAHLLASKQREDAVLQQQYAQQYAQQSFQQQLEGPNAVRLPGMGHEQYGVQAPYAQHGSHGFSQQNYNMPATGMANAIAPNPYQSGGAQMGVPTGPATMGAPQKLPANGQSVMPYPQGGGMHGQPVMQQQQQPDANFTGMGDRLADFQARKARRPMQGLF